jgi:CheY-like chemotaxis protein
MLVKDAFRELGIKNDFRSVENGKALLDYLRRAGDYADSSLSPQPDLILLDLNMPLVPGKEALKEIKASGKLRSIPVVVLTTSAEKANVAECYCLGASAYVVKPVGFHALTDAARSISEFWFHLVELPPVGKGC